MSADLYAKDVTETMSREQGFHETGYTKGGGVVGAGESRTENRLQMDCKLHLSARKLELFRASQRTSATGLSRRFDPIRADSQHGSILIMERTNDSVRAGQHLVLGCAAATFAKINRTDPLR